MKAKRAQNKRKRRTEDTKQQQQNPSYEAMSPNTR